MWSLVRGVAADVAVQLLVEPVRQCLLSWTCVGVESAMDLRYSYGPAAPRSSSAATMAIAVHGGGSGRNLC